MTADPLTIGTDRPLLVEEVVAVARHGRPVVVAGVPHVDEDGETACSLSVAS